MKRSAHASVVPLTYDAPRFTKPPWFANDLSAATLREYGWEGERIDVMQILNCAPQDMKPDVPCVIARIEHGGNILVNLDHVRAIENAPDGLAILYFAGDKSVAISESMDEFFMRAQGRK